MTPNLDTKALRALEANATPTHYDSWVRDTLDDSGVMIRAHDGYVASVHWWSRPQEEVCANADLIVALRNAAPALLDAAEERDKYRTAARVLCGAHIGLPQAACPVCERDALKAKNESLKGSLEEWKLDHASLKAEVERLREVLRLYHASTDAIGVCMCLLCSPRAALRSEKGEVQS